MCHAPRKENTIDRTIESTRNWSKDYNIIVRAEPKTRQVDNVDLRKNEYIEWCMQNHHKLFLDLLDSWEEWVLIAQDDFYYDQNAWDIIEDIIYTVDKDIWYYNFYTNMVYRWVIHKEWRTQLDIWYQTAYQVNYLMQTRVLHKVIQHPFYQKHLKTYKPNKQVDACISEVLHQLWLPMYYHNPSLSIHIWHSSSIIWHAHRYEDNFNSF